MQNFKDEFLKELTKLSLKYGIVINGVGVYYCVGIYETNKKGKYIFLNEEYVKDKIEWIDE